MKTGFQLLEYILLTMLLYSPGYSLNKSELKNLYIQKTCECIKTINVDKTSDLNFEIGMCSMTTIKTYEADYKKLHGAAVTTETLLKYNESVKEDLVLKCPQIMHLIKADEAKNSTGDFEGEVVEVTIEEFVRLAIKDTKGKTETFLILDRFEKSKEILAAPNSLKGKFLKITYRDTEIYRPKASEFVRYKVITKADLSR